ncbi:MAG: universal stress protein [Deltaproteobacteria bacterium]|nr:universal stress protein [Deltaproteobacteria bacterium]
MIQSPLGLVIATVFLISIISLLWWMLHAPPMVPYVAAKAHIEVEALKNIVVPTQGMDYSERGVEIASRLGTIQDSKMIFVYVIEVPRTLPLNARMEEEDKKAEEAIKHAVDLAVLHKMKSESVILRSRSAGEEIVKIAQEKDADVIVMGIRQHVGLKENIHGRTSDTVLRKAPCEVIIDKLPGEES